MPKAPPIHLIAGPTASGKSGLAISLAERLGGAVINADALQLYADLRVLSARPSSEDEARIPHHLYGIADGAEAWSVGRWLRAVTHVLSELKAEGRAAVIVGGTGLYFRALTEGLADIPAIPAEVRAAVSARYDAEGEAAIRRTLSDVDPIAETRITPGDRQRLVRALEVFEATGRALSAWRADTTPLLTECDYEAQIVEPPRATLYARCDARFAAMIEAGAAGEAEALAARGLAADLPVMKAVGLRPLIAWRRGEISADEAVTLGRQETRNYAKRQLTWFRNQTPEWARVTT